MRKNKILTAAIASALSLGTLGAGTVLAASPTLLVLQPAAQLAGGDPAKADFAKPATASEYAAELFVDADAAIATDDNAASNSFDVGANDDRHFIVGYKLDLGSDADARASTLIIVTATLNGGTWGKDILPTQALYCDTAGIVINGGAPAGCNATHGFGPVQISKSGPGGTDKDNVVSFSIQSLKTVKDYFNASDWFYFSFDVDDLVDFSAAGNSLSIEMKAEYVLGANMVTPLGSPVSKGLATFVRGASPDVNAAAPPPSKVVVDVAENSLKFKADATTTTKAKIGTIELASSIGSTTRDYDGSSNYIVGNLESDLTITNGPFSASRTEPGMVFLDVDNDNTYTAGTDILCAVKSDTTAECKVSSTVAPVVDQDGLQNGFKVPIIVVADGTTEILPQDDAPIGTWNVSIDGGTKRATIDTLTHIKSNGTKCTLYNIPDETGGLDGVSVRLTNKNTKLAGKVFGEIILEDGTKPYGSKPLELVTLEPSQTLRLFAGDAAANANEKEQPQPFDLTFGGKYSWPGQRARLYITSTLVNGDLEAVALVRNKLHGGPGMNMSTGATGTGCK
jgi:hypothetical protein